MSAALGFLQSGLDSVVPQLTLYLYQVFEGHLVVGIDGHPFAPLRRGVDGVDSDRKFARQVLPNNLEAESCRSGLRTVVVVAAALRLWPH